MRVQSNSGIILIVVLWILVILTVLAVSLGRRTSVELALTRHLVGQVKSKYIAMAGIIHVLEQIKRDKGDEESAKFDTKYQCGFFLKDSETPEDLFENVEIGSGAFQISYFSDDQKSGTLRYGLMDEESKINLNAITPNNYKILKYLFMQFEIDDEEAEGIASAVVDWRDETQDIFNEPYGAEDDYYSALSNPYHCKNGAFESLEELMLVKGMTPELFKNADAFLTVFPKSGRFLVNIDTAPAATLRAIAYSLAGAQTNTTFEDADSLVEKVIEFRNGDDGQFATEDDELVDANEMALNAKEKVIFLLMARYQTKVSNYLRVHVKGVDKNSNVPSVIDAVIFRDDLSLVYWHRH